MYDDGEACGFLDDEFLNEQHESVSAFSHGYDGQPDVSHKEFKGALNNEISWLQSSYNSKY